MDRNTDQPTLRQLVNQLPMVAYIGQSSFTYGKSDDLLLAVAVGVVAYVAMWVVISTIRGVARLFKAAKR